jgi:hypothetical protein
MLLALLRTLGHGAIHLPFRRRELSQEGGDGSGDEKVDGDVPFGRDRLQFLME